MYRGAVVRYEVGYGRQAADQYWFCSWALRALHTRRRTPARNEAVQNLEHLRSTFYFTVLHPKFKPYVERELRRAARGNLSMLQIDVEANCEGARK